MELAKKNSKRAGVNRNKHGKEAVQPESRALAKGLYILEHLAEVRQPMSLGDLAEVAGLGKPATFRILSTLQMLGW
ncbi:MAG TPA: helix-turn-helix domain-containing protein, partial [Bryobacteraceae bacterium]|nr:helix-turn-helix domain-containing protein [Bryobacteraceae bacterium]